MSLLISGVFDGPLPGGLPKGVELYVTADVADLSIFGIGSANNGGGSDGEEFTLSGSAAAGDFIYITTNATAFETFFGFAPTFEESTASNINGDDAIELFENGVVIDVFGDINVDGTGEPWEHLDGWAYTNSDRMPSDTFDPADWSFSGPNALDNETTNDTAATPFPVGSFATVVTPPMGDATFTLELLHFTDQEANAATIDNIDNLSAVLNALREQDLGMDGEADNTLTLSAGDAIIPGLFFDASEAVFGSQGIADIQIQNELGVEAIALGNHEFDLGTGLLAGLIGGSAPGDFTVAELDGTALEDLDFTGAAFPYLSANLDFSTDQNFDGLEVAGLQAPIANKVTSSVVLEEGGELIGVVGATVPTIRSISSPGDDLGISPAWASGSPTDAELDALAVILQAEVDDLLTANPAMNKVILASHMQQISIELALAERLENVDIIIAGGSNTRLFDDNDRVRDGDSDQGQYPAFVTNAGGTTTAVVNTDGNYKYVGRLVIDFDADGNIIADSYDETVSGAYATDDQGVADLNAAALVDPEVDAITDAIQAQIVATESNVFGVSDVFLNGNRSGTFAADDPDGVRTQETNLGNLTADANLAYANDMIAEQGLGDPVVVSIKNGGGIRANIGQIVVPAGGTEAERVPNEEILDSAGDVVKPAGGISQNDIATTLAFNNGLTLVDMTKTELRDFLEGAISALPVGVSGGFPQLSGLHFSFDETQTAQTYDVDGNIATPGERVVDAGIFAEDGTLIAEIVRDGEIVGDPSETFRVVTLNFLANAGDEILSTLSNPNRVDLIDLDADGESDDSFTGDAVFATDGSEQDALAEYLNDNFNPDNGGVAFSEADVGPDTDARIQNLTFRESDILEDLPGGPVVAPVATEELGEITEAVVLDSGVGEGSSEVVVYDSGRVYTTNGVAGGIDVWDPASGSQVDFYDLTFLPGFASVQSVAVKDGLAVAAVSTPDVADGGEVLGQNGYIVLIDTATGNVIDRVTVGNLPDMVTFNSDGLLVLVANEGEFNSEGDVTVDPAGSVSIVDVSNGALDPVGEEIDFSDLVALAEEKGIRLFPGISALTDLEPEYITVAGDTAYVALQEANAIAVLDIPTKTFTDIFSAGVVDHSQAGNELDANDDDIIDIRTFDNLVGLRMPDAISSFEKDGATYIITANEGDGRGDAPEGDEARVGDIIAGEVDGLSIDAAVDTTGLERLTVSTIDGDTDGDGDIDVLHAFGSRSFTIFDTDGNVVFDSGSQFEAIIAAVAPERFNDDDGDAGQNRSDAKGPEPEAVITGVVNGVLYAFIGLERDSGIMIYNIDNPASAFFVDYIPGFGGESGDHIAPETIAFIPADESASGVAQIAVAYEVSGETIVYDLGEVGDIGGTDPILINEFQPNPDGGDPADAAIELKGTPGTDFDVWLFSVESDPGNPGVVDRAENVTGTFDANGLAVVTVPDLENPSFTYVLATDFTGTVGDTDLDTDDDGVADDLSTVGDVLDAIGVPDAAGEPLYATQLGGTDLANVGTTEPSLTFRDGETGEIYSIFGGTVFDAAGNEVDAAEFDKDPTQTTFGDINPIRTGAQPDLQITEIWPGQDGTDVTADWFEITNVGSGAFNTGTLFYDDESADINDATQIIGIDTLAPGESAIVVIGNMGDATEFETVWGDDVDLTGVQVGFTDGSGLGGGGDAVNLYLDTDDTLTDDDLVDNEAYPDTDGNSGRSWDVANAQFSNVGALTNVVATDDLGGENDDEPAIASPGSLTDPIVVAPTPDVVINEYRISSAGDADDTSNFVELFTTPGASFDGLTLLVLSGEFNPGEINNAISLDGAVADENGFLLIANSANPELGDGDVGVADLDFFGSPTVFKVVDGFTGTEGGDLDGDNDGTLDTMPWTAELASLALIDGDGTADQTFGAADTLGPDGDFTPAAAARDVDGTGDFQILAFGDDSADTPGATNVIDPGTGDAVTIMEIQGAAHTSPLLDQTVATSGIVTAVDTNGFYVQDPDGDGDIATSDAIFVFTSSTPTVSVGDAVEITGTVSEFFPGGEDTGNLSTTQISGSPQVTVTSSNNALPTATILGAAGRAVPTENIDDDAFASFDPTTDGIDFFESLEAMLVTVDDPLAIAPTNRFGETFVVADNGAGATGLSERGTLNISPDDFNPEKIQIDPDSGILDISLETNVGATFQDISGVIGYSFGNFEVIPTEVVVTIDTPFPETEVAEIAGTEDQLTIASYNVLNLDPEDTDGDADVADGRFDAIAAQIVANLGTPDIIGLQEIQDNNGTLDGTGTGVVSADETLQLLIDAIVDAGGPTYSFIDNTFIGEDLSGGFPGGNIRTAFLYNDDRVDLVDGSVQTISGQGAGEAFEGARLPLVADFTFNGEEVTVVNNHFSSKGGSSPILGVEQPFEARQEEVAVNGSLDERQAQSAAVAGFVAAGLAQDAEANIVVLGDLNEFEFVSPVTGLEDAGLTNLTNTLDEDERYTFNFQGNSQSLDHILVSDALLEDAEFDIVHTNSEIFEDSARASDHDPLVVGLTLGEDGDDPVDTLGLWLFASGEEGLNSAENFDNPAQFLGGAMAQDGQAMLDGENDYILIDNIDDYEVQAGGLRMAFSVESLDGNSSGSNFGAQRLQALFSRDSSGFDGGGHLTGYVDGDGVIVIRHQTDDENYVIRTDPGVVSNGDQVALEYEFDPVNGMVLKVGINGAPLEIVGTNDQSILDGTPVSLVGNSEPWTLGVSQTRSGNGVASNLRQYFEGKIDSFEVFSGDGDPGIPSENSDPMAVNDTGTTAFETAIELDVIENDSDPDGDALVIASAGDAANGMVSVTDDNTLLYQPDTDFFGTDTFIYTVSDGNGGTATATVGVTVEEEPSNPMPTASLGEWLFEPDAPTANTAPGFENPAVFANGAEAIGGAVILDGEDDYVLISNIDDYEVGAVEVRMSFSVDTLSGTSVGSGFGSQELQTLFSRDSSGFDGGGHLTAFVNGDGSLRIRHQTEDANYAIDTLAGLFDEGDDVDLIYKVTPTDGMELYLGVNGGDLDMVGSNDQSVLDGNPVDLIGNSEPWTLGASQTRSNDETANKLRSFFDGSIDSFEIIQPSDDLFS